MTEMAQPEVAAWVSRALWGEVFMRPRCVQFTVRDGKLSQRLVVSEEFDDSDLDSINSIGAEVAVDFSDCAFSDGWHAAFQRKERSQADGRSFAA